MNTFFGTLTASELFHKWFLGFRKKSTKSPPRKSKYQELNVLLPENDSLLLLLPWWPLCHLIFFKGGLGRKFIEALAFLPLLISSPLPTRVIELKEGNKTEDFFP